SSDNSNLFRIFPECDVSATTGLDRNCACESADCKGILNLYSEFNWNQSIVKSDDFAGYISVEDCARACVAAKSCVHFLYDKDYGECYLRRNMSDPTPTGYFGRAFLQYGE